MLLDFNGKIGMNDKMKINLTDEVSYQRELAHALTYQKRSLLGRITFILALSFCGILWLLEMFSVDYPASIKAVLSWSVFGLGFFTPIHILIFGRCPNCKKIQPAGYADADISTGIEMSYTRGFTPFRKRCYYCGTYLSVKQLEKDKLKAKQA